MCAATVFCQEKEILIYIHAVHVRLNKFQTRSCGFKHTVLQQGTKLIFCFTFVLFDPLAY